MSADITIRTWTETDFKGIYECQRSAYADHEESALINERLLAMELEAFPEGQVLAEVDGKVVGYSTSLILDLEDSERKYLYSELTGAGSFNTHDPSGETLYGADIAVHPDYRGKGIAALLYEKRKELVSTLNLKRMIAYGRLPGFHEYSGRLTAKEYVEAVRQGTIKDIALCAHLKAGYQVKGILLDFFGDRSSLNHATLLEWENPHFEAERRLTASAPLRRLNRKVRVCTAQFLLKKIKEFEEFEQTVEFFAESARTYHCHFLVLPEYFTTQLIYLIPKKTEEKAAILGLAEMSEKIVDMLSRLAVKYQLYIIGGSTPNVRDGKLYNTSFLLSPSGNVYNQDKLHITPPERTGWGIQVGNSLKVFDTPLGRIAIQICYDIEFPEPARLLALSGVEIIFVPFNTDEQRSFNRVNFCSQARAVENYMYVVTSALVGNMPAVTDSLINYGRSAIFTPSDVAFPTDASLGIADPNVETIITSELDLEKLALQRELGSVLPFFDRRADLYKLEGKQKIEIVEVT